MGAKVQGKRRVLQALAGIGGWGWSPSRERGPEPRPSSLAGARPAAALRLPPLASLGFSSVTATHLQGAGGCGERSVDATPSLEITQRKQYQQYQPAARGVQALEFRTTPGGAGPSSKASTLGFLT